MRPVLLVVLGFAVVLLQTAAPAQDERAEPTQPGEHGSCYMRFGQNVDCVPARSDRDCQRRCDDRLCDEITWYPNPACWEWGWVGPGGR